MLDTDARFKRTVFGLILFQTSTLSFYKTLYKFCRFRFKRNRQNKELAYEYSINLISFISYLSQQPAAYLHHQLQSQVQHANDVTPHQAPLIQFKNEDQLALA